MAQRRAKGQRGQMKPQTSTAAVEISAPGELVVDANSLFARMQRAAQSVAAPATEAEEPPVSEIQTLEDVDRELGLDEEWESEVPEDHPDDVAFAQAGAISLDGVEDGDIDQLWDWVRQDQDKGLLFLGMVPQTYLQLRGRLEAFDEHLYCVREQSLADDTTSLVGFVGLHPVKDNSAGCHMYLAPDHRGRASQLVPVLMGMAHDRYPGMDFRVVTEVEGLARLYEGVGFKKYFLLVWKPVKLPAE